MSDYNEVFKIRILRDKLRNMEAAYERAHQQANDALSEAARLKERVAELEWSKDRGWQTHLEAEQEAVSLHERSEAAEKRERAKDEALRAALNRMQQVERWRDGQVNSLPMCSAAIQEAERALAQQPVEGYSHAGPSAPYDPNNIADDQPAQGECLDPHTLERAAQVAQTLDGDVYTDRAPLRSRLWAIFFPTISLRNMAKITRRRVAGDIRNLRDGGDT